MVTNYAMFIEPDCPPSLANALHCMQVLRMRLTTPVRELLGVSASI